MHRNTQRLKGLTRVYSGLIVVPWVKSSSESYGIRSFPPLLFILFNDIECREQLLMGFKYRVLHESRVDYSHHRMSGQIASGYTDNRTNATLFEHIVTKASPLSIQRNVSTSGTL